MYKFIKYCNILSFVTIYPKLLSHFWHHFEDINNMLLIVVSLQLCHLFSSLIANLYFAFFYYIDQPYFNQWKIETKDFPWKVNPQKWIETRNKTLLAVSRNFLIGIGFSLFDTVIMGAHYRCDQNTPSYIEVATQLLFCIILDDFFFYWGHRLLHQGFLYKRIHKEHHEYTVTTSISSEYAHPIEYVVGNILPVFAGPKLLGSSMHLISLIVWLTFKILRATSIHSGYSFPWSPFQSTEEFHSLHHSLNTGNYATGLRIWDKLMRTEIKLM